METFSRERSCSPSTASTHSEDCTTLFSNEDFTLPPLSPTCSISSITKFSDTSSIITARDLKSATTTTTRRSSTTATTKPWIPRGVLGKIAMGLGPSAVDLVSEYALKRHLQVLNSRIDLGQEKTFELLDIQVKELEDIYLDLLDRDNPGDKLQFLALKIRLSIIRLLLKVENPYLFSQMQRNALQTMWQDLEKQICSKTYQGSSIQVQACELKQSLLLRATDELCSENYPNGLSDAETALDGAFVIELLCKELAYSSGDYTIQNALQRIVNTEWGFELFSSLDAMLRKESNTLILDCISRLLSYDNVFSCTMAIRIFGRLSRQNLEIHSILTGPMGVPWLVDRLGELSHSRIYTKQRWRGRSVRAVESYCNALFAACVHGFADLVIKLGTTMLLLRLIKIFTIRDQDPKVCSQIEENHHDDLDVERDQIACCELISYLLEIPHAKRRILPGACRLRAFKAHSNRLVSDQKLLSILENIMKSLEE